jgi:hypothetical protein
MRPEAKNDRAAKGQQQFNRPIYVSQYSAMSGLTASRLPIVCGACRAPDIFEEHIASIFRIKEEARREKRKKQSERCLLLLVGVSLNYMVLQPKILYSSESQP